MSAVRQHKPGYVVTYPNREKASSQVTKVLTMAVLILSAVIVLLMTFGGWSKMEGLIPLDIIWGLVYLLMAWYVFKWARGLLPIAAALAALMLTFAVIALTGYTGVAWSDRSGAAYSAVHSVFGGGGLSAGTMNFLTVIVVITQVALIIVAMRGFGQAWNIEYEIPEADAAAKGYDTSAADAAVQSETAVREHPAATGYDAPDAAVPAESGDAPGDGPS